MRHALSTHSRPYLSPVTPEQRYCLHSAAYSSVSAVRVERTSTAPHKINDAAAALTVTDAKRVGVATNRAPGGIDVSLVGAVGARRQLRRTITVNRPLDQRIVEEAGDVVPELRVPFAAGRGRVGLLLRRDGGLVERGVELFAGALHHQRVDVIDAEVALVLGVQQANAAIRTGNADQHAWS